MPTMRVLSLPRMHRLLVLLAGAVIWGACLPLWAVNAPTITHIQNRPVMPGVTNYATTVTNLEFRGNAEVGTTIRLFRAGSLVGTGVTGSTGQWVIVVPTVAESRANFDADASDGVFTSARCPAVDVHVDAHAPNLSLLSAWGSNQYPYYWVFSSSYYYHTISEWGGTSGSGIDFTTASMTIRDLTADLTIPVVLTSNLIDRVDFAPQPNDAQFRVDGHQYAVWFQIADKAGNVAIASRTFICDLTPPSPPTVLKIYDPLHNQFTGLGETPANVPDPDGYVNYFPNMTIATQPTRFRGIVPSPNEFDKGPNCYLVYPNYGQNCTVANGLLDPVTGSWTSEITYTFFSGLRTFYVYSYDSANNTSYQSITLDFANPVPTCSNLKIWDPGHHVFSGTGEPSTNLPDADGFVDYYPNMSISSQPTRIKGNIPTSNFRYMYFYVPAGSGWSGPYQYVGSEIDATTGSFTYSFPNFPDGTYPFYWYFINSSNMSGFTQLYIKFIDGPPPPPSQITAITPPRGYYYPVHTNNRRVPDFSGKAAVYSHPQTIWLKGQNIGGTFGSTYQYAQVVLPAGQPYPNTPGVYDPGEPFQDVNQNGRWDTGEPFLDIAGKGVSDGQTFSIPNFLNIEFPNGMYYSSPIFVISRGPAYDSGIYNLYYWFSDWVNPIVVQNLTLLPAHPTNYRKSSQKPTSLEATVYKPAGYTSPDTVYGLATTTSRIWIANNLGENVLAPVASWTYVGSPLRYSSILGLGSVPFGQGTYRIHVLTETIMGVQLTNSSFTFKIDDIPPQAQDFVPTDGALANGFSSFNAKMVDPFLPDNSEGSGANLDVALPQIWPFRILSLQVQGNDSNILSFPLTGGETSPKNHLGEILPLGSLLEIWEVSGGAYQNASHACTLEEIHSGTVVIKKISGTFASTKSYVALYSIPCFTANNGLDRVGAVPINPITEDGQYVCRVVTLDKAGNAGTFYAPYSRLELAFGPISLVPSKNFLFVGLVPPDVATFTSNSLRTRKGNLVQDRQAVTIQRSPEILTAFTLPDANGLPGDGYQVLTGENGVPSGEGKFAFGVAVTGTTAGTLTTIAGIGLASGSSAGLPMVVMEPFSLVPATTTPAITPDNPSGTVAVGTTFLGYAGVPVPDGSLATWTCFSAVRQTIPSSGCSMSGFHSSYWYPAQISDGNFFNSGQLLYSPSFSAPSPGAYFRFDFEASPKPLTNVRVSTGGTLNLIWDVQYSDDAVAWTTVYSGFMPTGGSSQTEAKWPPCGAHRYWRLLLTNTPTNYGSWIYEIAWYVDDVQASLAGDASGLPGFQSAALAGSTTVTVSAAQKGMVALTATMGTRTATYDLMFLDRYPPPPPALLVASPSFSLGMVNLTWASSTDIGGAGMGDYLLERSLASGAYVNVATTTLLTASQGPLPDGNYEFRVRARDLDGNIGHPGEPVVVIIDTVPPPAIACSDIGPGNTDPDEEFSVDPSISFYFTPADDRSGPAEVNIQIATMPDFNLICHEVWVPTTNVWEWTAAPSGATYYARVRVKDRAGNIGPFGTPSNGITVNYTGATTPPNAPTITTIAGKPAIPGTPIYTNLTMGIVVTGMCEASNLVEMWVDGAYVRSTIASPTGFYSHTIALSPGQHLLKTRTHNGFAMSAFSTEIQVVVDIAKPTLDLRLYRSGNWLIDNNWASRVGGAHDFATVNLVMSDAGGSGIDINTASITVMDINDDGVPLPSTASFPNPVPGSISVLTANTVQFVPNPSWATVLQDQHRYRIFFEGRDLAGNRATGARDIAIDSLSPSNAAGVPATGTSPTKNFRELFVYDAEAYPSNVPPLASCVPLIWSDGDNAYVVDPTYSNPALVDTSSYPPAILFTTPGIYGHLWTAEPYNPPPQTNRDTLTYSTGITWSWGSGIYMSPNINGHTKWFRYTYRPLPNGPHTAQFQMSDSAQCRNYANLRLNVRSSNPAPRRPIAARFFDATNPAIEYSAISYQDVFPIPDTGIFATSWIVTTNNNPLMIRVEVPIETFDQRVEMYDGNTVYASATIPAGSNMGVLLVESIGTIWDLPFRIRNYANGYYATDFPHETLTWYYHYIRADQASPTVYDLIPVETNFNALSGPDAKPFPTRFSIRAKDTTNGTNRSWLYIPQSTARLQNKAGEQMAGTLTREYDSAAAAYGFRYDLTSVPTAEGTYYYYVSLKDAARPTANVLVASFPFRLDKTPPVAADITPGNGSTTNSLPSFSCRAVDPALADGTAGSGPNLDPGLVQVEPFKELGRGSPTNGTTISVTIAGVDTTATDHVDSPLAVGTSVALARVSGSTIERPQRIGTITSNGGDILKVSLTSGSPMVLSETYAVLWAIPCFQSNDGNERLAAVPIQPAVKGGNYVAFFNLSDKSKNKGTYTSASCIYEAAYGPFTLTPNRTTLYAGLVPPHAATYVSGPIRTTSGNPVQPGTQVTVFTQPSLGTFAPADANGIPGDGHQVACGVGGVLTFQLLASGTALGRANVKAVLGLASGSDSSVVFIQLPPFSVNIASSVLAITPGNLNPSTTITAGTFGNPGDLVPNGTMLNASASRGSFSPADAIATWPGHQVPITGGTTSFTFTSGTAGTATLTFECGGRVVTRTITILDQVPPTAPGVPAVSPTLSGTGNFLVTWTAATDPGDSGIAHYRLQCSQNGGAWVQIATVSLPIFNTSNLPHGKFRFRAQAVDGAGNVGPVGGASAEVEVDKMPPIGTIVVNDGAARTATTSVKLTLTASDANGVSKMSFSNDGIGWSAWVPFATTYQWSLTSGDGVKIVFVRFQDAVGNISVPQQDGIILDTTGPEGSIAISPAPYTATTTLDVSLNYVDGAGVPWMTFQEDALTPMTVAAQTSYKWHLQPIQGTHTLAVSFVDGLGNRSATFSAMTYLDSIPPTTPVVKDDGAFSPFMDRLHATWLATDTGSGLGRYLVRIGTSPGTDNIASTTDMGLATEHTFGPFALDLSGSTQYYFTVWAVDRAGRISAPGYSDGIKAGDSTPPAPVTVTDDGVYSGASTTLHASWTASHDPDSGINRYEFGAGTSPGATDIVPWTSVGLSLSYTATGLSLSHGTTYWIGVRVFNNGGTSTVSLADGITIDLQPPPVPPMLPEPAFTSGTVNLVACSPVTDGLSGGVEYFFQSATDAGFGTGVSNSGWVTTPSYTFTGRVHGTTYYYRVRARDAVGNESGWSTAVSSRQDSNPPIASAYSDQVPGNNDPDHVWTRDTTVAFEAIGLSDDLSGVKNVYLQVCQDGIFATLLYNGWLHNTTGAFTGTFAVPDGATLTARARFEDVAGNLSGWYTTDGIRVDLTDPTPGATYDTGSVSAVSTLIFSFPNATDSPSGIADIRIQVASDAAFTLIATDVWLGSPATSFAFPDGVDGCTYTARIMARDRAGRVSSWGAPSNGIYVDLSPPAPLGPAFLINGGDQTTASWIVRLSFTVNDPSGVAVASVSNDGVTWTAFHSPLLHPASYVWILAATDTAEVKTIRVRFQDGVGHVSPIYTGTIGYFPYSTIEEGDMHSGIYPTDTYDQYPGQNKYGTDRSMTTAPTSGRSLKLKKP